MAPRLVDQSVTYRVRPGTNVVARPVDETVKASKGTSDGGVLDVLKALSPAVEGYVRWQEAQAQANATLGSMDQTLGIDPRRPKGFSNIGWGYNKGYNIADGEARSSGIISEYTQELARQNFFLTNPNNEGEVIESRQKRMTLLRDITQKHMQGTTNPDVLAGASEKVRAVMTQMEEQASKKFSQMRSEQLQKNLETSLAGVFLTEDPEYIKGQLTDAYETIGVPMGVSRPEFTAMAASMTIKSVQSYIDKAEETQDIEFLKRADTLLKVFKSKDASGISWADIRMGTEDGIPEYPFGKLYEEGKQLIRSAASRIESKKNDEYKERKESFMRGAFIDATSGDLRPNNLMDYMKKGPPLDFNEMKALEALVDAKANTWEANDPVLENYLLADINHNPGRYTEFSIADLMMQRKLGTSLGRQLIKSHSEARRAAENAARTAQTVAGAVTAAAEKDRLAAQKEFEKDLRDERRANAANLRDLLKAHVQMITKGADGDSYLSVVADQINAKGEKVIEDYINNPNGFLDQSTLFRLLRTGDTADAYHAVKDEVKNKLRRVAVQVTQRGGNGAKYLREMAVNYLNKEDIEPFIKSYKESLIIEGETQDEPSGSPEPKPKQRFPGEFAE